MEASQEKGLARDAIVGNLISARSGERMQRSRSMNAGTIQVVCFTHWFRQHNNPRYAVLFPYLESVVRFHRVTLSHRRLVRGVQFRLWKALSQRVIYPAAARYFGRRYRTVFTVDIRQIPAWPETQRVVVDMDDPVFSPMEIKILKLPQVKAIVVTTKQAKSIYRRQGIACPIYVIPQGVSVEQIDPNRTRDIGTQFREDRDVVVGYHAPTLTLSRDGPGRAREGQDDLDFLFAALENARKTEPRIKLWLIGEPSASVKKYAADGRAAWIRLFGYVPLSDMLNYVANFDLGVYPRTWAQPPARFNVKLAQFMACGVPVVATELDESLILKESGSGIVSESEESFSQSLVRLAQSAEARAVLADAGRRYARENLDWSLLVPMYKEILMG
jgi:glycosyltransferase involved in cell wall biosynthesis